MLWTDLLEIIRVSLTTGQLQRPSLALQCSVGEKIYDNDELSMVACVELEGHVSD